MIFTKDKITKEEINEMPVESFGGTINMVETEADADKALKTISEYDIVGIDTETRPSFKKGQTNKVSLLQISTEDTCWLFRLNKIGYPDSLVRFFEDSRILKIGLSLKDDFRSLHKCMGFNPEGYIELQNFAGNFGITEKSLQKIYAIIFGKKISKSQRLTNWNATQLTERQKTYAATDAWACLKIYEKLTGEDESPAKSGKINIETTNE